MGGWEDEPDLGDGDEVEGGEGFRKVKGGRQGCVVSQRALYANTWQTEMKA